MIIVLKNIIMTRVKLLAPFAPYLCEEIWETMGNDGFISLTNWPKIEEKKIDEEAEEAEEMIKNTLEDTLNILKVTKIKPKKIFFYTSSNWKWKAYLQLLEMKEDEMNIKFAIRKLLVNPDMKKRAKELSLYISKNIDELLYLPIQKRTIRKKINQLNELKILEENKAFFIKELESEVHIFNEDDIKLFDPKGRAKLARPYRPAIYIE
jgi:leucyl-tRNA synthetase